MADHDIFLSYSRRDLVVVEQFGQQMEAGGYRLWFDEKKIRTDDNWKRALAVAIDEAQVLIWMVSRESCESRVVRKEVEHAIAKGKGICMIYLEPFSEVKLPPEIEDELGIMYAEVLDRATLVIPPSLVEFLAENHDIRPRAFHEKRRTLFLVFLSFAAGIWAFLGLPVPNLKADLKAGDRREFTLEPGLEVPFRWCPPGTFLMGSPTDEEGRSTGLIKETQHEVTLSEGFWIAETETTQEFWEKIMGNNPSDFTKSGSQAPVEKVSWDDVQEFLGRLPEGFVLPSEAQWEYACRAGTTSPFNVEEMGLDELAWFGDNSEDGTHPVGQKKPNAWGITDMHGNVSEWCRNDLSKDSVTEPGDPVLESLRFFRGGSWRVPAKHCRSASRSGFYPVGSYNFLGFRLILSSISEREKKRRWTRLLPDRPTDR